MTTNGDPMVTETAAGIFSMPQDRAKEEFTRILSAAKRQRRLIAGSVGACFALSILYLIQAVPTYTATTSLLIDSKQVGLSAGSAFEGNLAFETGAVDSQVLVLMSDRVASSVVDHLDLVHDDGFVNPKSSLLGATLSGTVGLVRRIVGLLGVSEVAPEFEQLPVDLQRVVLVERLKKNLKVTRNARTYVLTVEYSDDSPVRARSIASTYASAYLEDQLESRFETARRATNWLDERIKEVRSKASAADQTVQAFRVKNKLTEASGRLINEQALTDAGTQLSAAKNDLNSAQAKYDRLKQIVASKDLAASNIDTMNMPIISQLRSKYLEASKLNSDISLRLGPQHQSAVNARKEMDQYAQLIFDEMSRLLKTYQSEVQIASDRVTSLERSIEAMRGTNDLDAGAKARLRTLEQEAATYNTLYASYLQKAQDLLQQQSLPISDARIITDAALPILPSAPKTLLVVIASLFLGLLIGASAAFYREFRERGFRTSGQVRDELGLEFAAYVPEMPANLFEARDGGTAKKEGSSHAKLVQPRHIGLELVVQDPLSRFSEAMRAVKISTDYRFSRRRPLVLGFVSMFPNEGKTTIAKNFASLAASQGERTLLVDGDLRNPQLTRELTPTTRTGLLDLLFDPDTKIDDCLHLEEPTGLAFLPGSARGRVPASGDALGSAAMNRLIEDLRGRFGLVILDLPPLGAVLDAVAASNFIDGFHLIIEWGRTPRVAVRDILAGEPGIAARVIGVTLSKVRIEDLEQFDTHAAYGYTGEYLGRYYGKS